VLIDLKKNAKVWEDFYDLAFARERKDEPREPLQSVMKRLKKSTKRQSNG
jgi:hypothetical protein